MAQDRKFGIKLVIEISKLKDKLILAANDNQVLRDGIKSAEIAAYDKGFEQALQLIEMKLLDGGETDKTPNEIRAEAAQRVRQIGKDVKEFMDKHK